MADDIRFAPRAVERPAEIAECAVRSFGAAQAERYAARLADRLATFAEGRAMARHETLMALKAGRHLMILMPDGRGWVVIDILHDAQDLSSLTHDHEEP